MAFIRGVKASHINEFILALYLSWIALSKYFTSILSLDSALVLAVPVIGFLIFSLVVNSRGGTLKPQPLIVMLTAATILAFSAAFYSNDTVISYAYNFLLYGVVPLYLLSRVTELEKFFKYTSYLGIVTIICLGLDPLNQYLITGDYMVYGYFVMLPVFTSLYVARKYYGVRWLFIFEIIALILIIAFANRGATLAAVSLIIMSNLFVDTLSRGKVTAILVGGLIGVLGFLNINSILEWSIDTVNDYGVSSYALETFRRSIEGETDGLSGRDGLWDEVPVMFNESPIFGHGVAAFEDRNVIYAHNIILEILVSFGIIGIAITLIFTIYYFYRMYNTVRSKRLLYVLGISIGIIPLMFSMQPFIWYSFWLFTLNPNYIIRLPEKIKNNRIKRGSIHG